MISDALPPFFDFVGGVLETPVAQGIPELGEVG